MEKKKSNLFSVSLTRLWSIKAFYTEVVIRADISGDRFVLRIRNNRFLLPDLEWIRLVPTYHSKISNYRLYFPSQNWNKFARADTERFFFTTSIDATKKPLKIKTSVSSSMSVNECINQVVSDIYYLYLKTIKKWHCMIFEGAYLATDLIFDSQC